MISIVGYRPKLKSKKTGDRRLIATFDLQIIDTKMRGCKLFERDDGGYAIAGPSQLNANGNGYYNPVGYFGPELLRVTLQAIQDHIAAVNQSSVVVPLKKAARL